MKKIKFPQVFLLFGMILSSCNSSPDYCSRYTSEDGKAVIFANSIPTLSNQYYNTSYKFIDSNCKCKEVQKDITVESYSKGDTVYVKSDMIIGSY